MRLDEYLAKRKMSPDRLAELAGCHRATIYRLLKGGGYQPTLETALNIESATHMAVTVQDLAS